MLVRSLVTLLMKSRKRLACEVFDTLAARTGLVYGISDADCWAQNGSTSDCCVFATLTSLTSSQIRKEKE